jgi:hypothetical protein
VRLGVGYQPRYGVEFSWSEYVTHFTQTVAIQCAITEQGNYGSDNYRRARSPKYLP